MGCDIVVTGCCDVKRLGVLGMWLALEMITYGDK